MTLHSSLFLNQPVPVGEDDSIGAVNGFPLIVFASFPWNSVWHRPQQLLSRLSRRHQVLYVEPAVGREAMNEPRASLRTDDAFSHIEIMSIEVPAPFMQSRDLLDNALKQTVCDLLLFDKGDNYKSPVLWFYDAMAAPVFTGLLQERGVVYDCMDRTCSSVQDVEELERRERHLLMNADAVIAAGPKMHTAKKKLYAGAQCFGSGVDAQHFGKARMKKTEIPDEVGNIRRPILGYFGTLDERLDYDLIHGIAVSRPEWNIVLVGPTGNVDISDLSRFSNIYCLGQRSYMQLPDFAKAFDVCILPFAVNAHTEFSNPTKMLEYMATGKPVVSTAVDDVVRQHSDVIRIAANHREFIEYCERSIEKPNKTMVGKALKKAADNSWDCIVIRIEHTILDALAAKEHRVAA